MKSAIWCLAIAQTLLWCSLYYLFPAMLMHWESAYGWSRSELSLALTIAVAVSAVFAPWAGRIIDRGYGAVMMGVSAAAGGIILLSLVWVDQLVMFYLLWGLMGVAMAGCLYEPCFAFVVRHMGDGAKRAITLITLAAGFAGTICFPAVHWLMVDAGLQMTLWLFAACVIFLAAPLLGYGSRLLRLHGQRPVIEEETPELSGTKQAQNSYRQSVEKSHFLRSPLFWLLAGSFALTALNHGVVLTHLLPILDARQMPDSWAVLAISMIGPMQVAGRLLWMLLDKHLDVLRINLICLSSIAVATLCLIFSVELFYLLAGFVLLQGAAYGVISILKPLVAREVMGEKNFGAITGAMAVPYLLSFAIAPYLGALVWKLGGYDLVLWCILACAVMGAGCFLLMLKKHQQQRMAKTEDAVVACC